MTRARDLANIADGTFTATDLDLSGTLTVSGDATFDTNTLFVDVSTDRVGVGTTSPATALDVSATSPIIRSTHSLSGDYLQIFHNGSGAYIDFSADPLIIRGASSTERMRIDSAGLVGIGTSSPGALLDVEGGTDELFSVGTSTRKVYFRPDSGGVMISTDLTQTGTGMYLNDASDYAYIMTADTERMRIDASGNVGIGTSSPSSFNQRVNAPHLVVGSGSNAAGVTIYSGAATQGSINFADGTTTTQQYEGGLVYNHTAGYMGFHTNGGGERMRIDSSGNLLVGTTSSSGAKIESRVSRTSGSNATALILSDDVTGLQTSGFGTQIRGLSNGGSAVSAIGFEASGGTNNDTGIAFYTQSTAAALTRRMTINSIGNLLVGTTTPGEGISYGTDGVTTIKGVYGAMIKSTGGAGYEALSLWNEATSGTINQIIFRDGASGSSRGTVTTNGSSTSYNTSSDYRLKDVDGPITNSGAYIDALKPVQGSWKADGSRFIGLIAHEVQEVSETPIATGEKDGEEMQGMDYSAPELIANLIAEIQSLRARVAQLEGA